MLNKHLLRHWYERHTKQGGYVGVSFVDWNFLTPPLKELITLLEKFKKLPLEEVMAFTDTYVTDNAMPNRDTLEDGSKIFYLVNQIEFLELLFHPQILHEPWYDRYRVHPGSGRLQALWLCGYENIKTIYTHFDEPGFAPPPRTIKCEDYKQIEEELVFDGIIGPPAIDYEFYEAFPQTQLAQIHTQKQDREWHFENHVTDKQWHFFRYSEGTAFLEYKNEWRSYALEMWHLLQGGHLQLGKTEFSFDLNGTCYQVFRKNKLIWDLVD